MAHSEDLSFDELLRRMHDAAPEDTFAGTYHKNWFQQEEERFIVAYYDHKGAWQVADRETGIWLNVTKTAVADENGADIPNPERSFPRVALFRRARKITEAIIAHQKKEMDDRNRPEIAATIEHTAVDAEDTGPDYLSPDSNG